MRSTLHDPLLTPENRLWRAVLEQACVDAESGSSCHSDAKSNDDGDGSHERRRARCYLRGDSKQDAASLIAVCDFAEIPADRVLNWARRNYPQPRTQSPPASHARSQNSSAIVAREASASRTAAFAQASA